MTHLQEFIQQGLNLLDERKENNLHNSISALFENNFNVWKPCIDVVETPEELFIYVVIPAVENDSIDVDFYNNLVTIKGKRENFHNDTDILHRSEIIRGTFERKIKIPLSVTSRENVKITSSKGILTIRIDKMNEERNKFSVKIEEE